MRKLLFACMALFFASYGLKADADAEKSISLSFSGSRIRVNSVSPVTGIVLTDLSGRRVYTAAEGSELDASKVRRGAYVLDVNTADGCHKAFKLAFGR